MPRVGEEFPLECPNCGGDIQLIAFITQPEPIRKILTHLGAPLEPPHRRQKRHATGEGRRSVRRFGLKNGETLATPDSHQIPEPLVSPETVAEVRLAGLSFR
ncbi:MAG: hypothetical protein LW698_09325 [Planctomycetaceae bacterium]|jgi:hypothetical protein|nr:hypothetical protein [Planctomycetaceae bacterium]